MAPQISFLGPHAGIDAFLNNWQLLTPHYSHTLVVHHQGLRVPRDLFFKVFVAPEFERGSPGAIETPAVYHGRLQETALWVPGACCAGDTGGDGRARSGRAHIGRGGRRDGRGGSGGSDGRGRRGGTGGAGGSEGSEGREGIGASAGQVRGRDGVGGE